MSLIINQVIANMEQLEELNKSLLKQIELIKTIHEDNLEFRRLLIKIAETNLLKK